MVVVTFPDEEPMVAAYYALILRKQGGTMADKARRETHEYRVVTAEPGANPLAGVANAIGFVVGVIEVFLLLRFIFRLLGAQITGFTQFLYSVTEPFVAPFRGIFPTPEAAGSVLEVATIVAILIVALIGYILMSLVRVLRPE